MTRAQETVGSNPTTGWTFFSFIWCKNCIVCLLEKTEKTKKKPGMAHFKKN